LTKPQSGSPCLHPDPAPIIRTMKRLLPVSIVVVAVAIARGVQLWLAERKRREVFPARDAAVLLNPARRLIQRPESVVRAFGLKPGDTVLEVGPGPGYFSPVAAAAVRPGGRLICFDLQPEMLGLLRRRLDESGAAGRVDLVAGDAMQLPFREEAFDAAFLVAVLGEVPEPQAAARELARVLRPGGDVSFCETFTDPDYVRLPVMRATCATAGLTSVGWQRQLIGYIARFSKPA